MTLINLKMKKLLYILLPFQFLIAQTNNDLGYVLYKVSLTEAYIYSEEYKNTDLENYNRALQRDSLMNDIMLGAVFTRGNSQSFRLKPYKENSVEYDAIYKANGIADYSYNSKTNISKVSMKYWFEDVVISVSLKNKWDIDYKKTKIIDGNKCYYAVYKGKGLWWELNPEKPTYAWFATDIPLPYGPLHYNGLPGLILELNVENVRYTATKIVFDDTYITKLKPLDLSSHNSMTEEEFIRERAEIRRKAKRIMIGG